MDLNAQFTPKQLLILKSKLGNPELVDWLTQQGYSTPQLWLESFDSAQTMVDWAAGYQIQLDATRVQDTLTWLADPQETVRVLPVLGKMPGPAVAAPAPAAVTAATPITVTMAKDVSQINNPYRLMEMWNTGDNRTEAQEQLLAIAADLNVILASDNKTFDIEATRELNNMSVSERNQYLLTRTWYDGRVIYTVDTTFNPKKVPMFNPLNLSEKLRNGYQPTGGVNWSTVPDEMRHMIVFARLLEARSGQIYLPTRNPWDVVAALSQNPIDPKWNWLLNAFTQQRGSDLFKEAARRLEQGDEFEGGVSNRPFNGGSAIRPFSQPIDDPYTALYNVLVQIYPNQGDQVQFGFELRSAGHSFDYYKAQGNMLQGLLEYAKQGNCIDFLVRTAIKLHRDNLELRRVAQEFLVSKNPNDGSLAQWLADMLSETYDVPQLDTLARQLLGTSLPDQVKSRPYNAAYALMKMAREFGKFAELARYVEWD